MDSRATRQPTSRRRPAPETVTDPSPDGTDLWWKDGTDGVFPLTGRQRLTVLLEEIDRRKFLIIEQRGSGRVCQALGLPDAMTVEIGVDVDQMVVARESEPASARVNIQTYSGIDHPADPRELFGASEASFVLWQWVTTGVLPAGYAGQLPAESEHYTRNRRRQQWSDPWQEPGE